MSLPTSLVWGTVPNTEQRRALRNALSKVLADARPPLPPAYATMLLDSLMGEVESWDWWQHRWYGEYEDL